MGVLLLASGLTGARGGDGPTDRPPRGDPGERLRRAPAVAEPGSAPDDRDAAERDHCPRPDPAAVPGRLLHGRGQPRVCRRAGGGVDRRGSPAEKGAATPYQVQVYLAGSRLRSAASAMVREQASRRSSSKRGKAVVVKADIGGEVFVTADNKATGELAAAASVPGGGRRLPEGGPGVCRRRRSRRPRRRPRKPGKAEPNEPAARYTINISPLTPTCRPSSSRARREEGEEIITFIGRIVRLVAGAQRERATGESDRTGGG